MKDASSRRDPLWVDESRGSLAGSIAGSLENHVVIFILRVARAG